MALSLGVSKGSEIVVGLSDREETIQVLDVECGTRVAIKVMGKRLEIDDQERVEVLPEVFVSCGLSNPHRGSRTSRLAFEAPRRIKINRVRKADA